MSLTPLEGPHVCKFNDIMQMMSSKTIDALGKSTTYKGAKSIISKNLLPDSRYCESHDAQCGLPNPDIHIAGPHCNDHSRQGNLAGRDGVTAPLFLCLCKTLKRYEIKLVVLENVTTGDFRELVSES